MNIFRFLADMSHLFAMTVLPIQIIKKKSCAGLSGKTQLFYLIVFVARYLDVFSIYGYSSLYATSLKVLFVFLTLLTVGLIYLKYKSTYNKLHELYCAELLIIFTLALAFLCSYDTTALEILWAFSIYLESVAIIPQLYMISKVGVAHAFTGHYVFLLGIYRTLYLANWVWRYYEEGHFDPISVYAGIIQTLLYLDFFYLYFTRDPLLNLQGDEDEKVVMITNI